MDRLQPVDINKLAKEFLQGKFQLWFADQIVDHLEDDTPQVDMRLSILKPLTAYWLVALNDHISTNPTFINPRVHAHQWLRDLVCVSVTQHLTTQVII